MTYLAATALGLLVCGVFAAGELTAGRCPDPVRDMPLLLGLPVAAVFAYLMADRTDVAMVCLGIFGWTWLSANWAQKVDPIMGDLIISLAIATPCLAVLTALLTFIARSGGANAFKPVVMVALVSAGQMVASLIALDYFNGPAPCLLVSTCWTFAQFPRPAERRQVRDTFKAMPKWPTMLSVTTHMLLGALLFSETLPWWQAIGCSLVWSWLSLLVSMWPLCRAAARLGLPAYQPQDSDIADLDRLMNSQGGAP